MAEEEDWALPGGGALLAAGAWCCFCEAGDPERYTLTVTVHAGLERYKFEMMSIDGNGCPSSPSLNAQLGT